MQLPTSLIGKDGAEDAAKSVFSVCADVLSILNDNGIDNDDAEQDAELLGN